jgi:UDP-GlcNAc:undecaprenyl-phosphate/decaprenyl-phosphate GlcNAc-1-phosphate transferase
MGNRLVTTLVVLAMAYAASTALVPAVRSLALRLSVVDHPGERKVHRSPVPLLGGLAIYFSLLVVILSSLFVLPLLLESAFARSLFPALAVVANYKAIAPKLWALLGGATVVVIVGIVDDVRGVNFPPLYKLGGEILAAVLLLPAGIYMDLLVWSVPLTMLVSVIWVVGITNAMNLLDNMDGLSSGVALICSCMFLVLVTLRGEFFIALFLAGIIGSTLGFYQFNISRGGWKIFLGDTGSLLLGFLLGALSLIARYVEPSDQSLFPVVAPLIILGLPVFDTFSVIAIRLLDRRPIFKGDQMHLSHRLVRMGMSVPQAVNFVYLLTLAIGLNAFFIVNSRSLQSVLAVVQVGVLVAMVTILMNTHSRGNGVGSRDQVLGDT